MTTLMLLAIACLLATEAMALLVLHGTMKPTRFNQALFYTAITADVIFGGLCCQQL